MNENLCAENPDAGKPSCHAWPRIPLNAIDDYRCGLERGHDGDHRATSKERLRWHDKTEQSEGPAPDANFEDACFQWLEQNVEFGSDHTMDEMSTSLARFIRKAFERDDAEQALPPVTDEMVAKALNAYHERTEGRVTFLPYESLLALYPELVSSMRQAIKAALNGK